MKGPSSGRRPETTGSRGGSASGSIGRSAGGCPAAAQTVLRPVGSHARASSELSRPDADSREEAEDIRHQMSSEVPDNGVSAHGGAAACAAANDGDMTITNSTSEALAGFGGNRRSNSANQVDEWHNEWHEPECAVIKGTGESVFFQGGSGDGMMQDPAQMAQERLERVEVLAGCGGEALRERYYGSRNGGAAACAAACRIEQIGGELQELQERIADLVVERRELQRSVQSDGAGEQGAEDNHGQW